MFGTALPQYDLSTTAYYSYLLPTYVGSYESKTSLLRATRSVTFSETQSCLASLD